MKNSGLFSVTDLNIQTIGQLFSLASQFKHSFVRHKQFLRRNESLSYKSVALVFFESSTRTRFSFEMACNRLGIRPVTFIANSTTSIKKGETALDTLLNLHAVQPDAFIIRSDEDEGVREFFKTSQKPCISAGYGKFHHPTQALLDAFTIKERLGEIKGKKIVFIGDVRHSRVAHSNKSLLLALGAEVAICSPKDFMPSPSEWGEVENFEQLTSALDWCDVAMSLRVQKERHSTKADLSNFIQNYQLNKKSIGSLSDKAIIMHPGPFVVDEEITRDIVKDSRTVIHQQVENGVYVRAALLQKVLGDR